jgi:hypothetical protein
VIGAGLLTCGDSKQPYLPAVFQKLARLCEHSLNVERPIEPSRLSAALSLAS